MQSNAKSKARISSLGLLLITVWSAVQYVFLQNVPDTVSTFSFLCITNLVGLIILVFSMFKRLKEMTKKTLIKGALMSLELIGFNFFLLLGSRNLNAVVVSSVVSMYFAFVTPILILCKKKVSFRSGVAVVVAVIAILLLFDVNFEAFSSSQGILYLIIADIFFAAYVVTVSILGDKEDSSLLTVSQMAFATVFSFVGWIVEIALGKATMTFSGDIKFWICVIFIGVFIRALYTRIQISCQKNVPPINAALIFSSEIVITLILNPLLCKAMNTVYEPITIYQIIGSVLFVIAVLVTDDDLMRRFGYYDMDYRVEQEDGQFVEVAAPLSRKIVNMNLLIGLGALVLCTVISLVSIFGIRGTVLKQSSSLGQEAASTSENALINELQNELVQTASDKAKTAETRMESYGSAVEIAADYAGVLLSYPDDYEGKEVMYPRSENGGVWTMQRSLATQDIAYESVKKQNMVLGNLETVFRSIIENYDNVSCLYIGTEDGLLISYDKNSDYAEFPGQENYYDYTQSDWYNGVKAATSPVFTEAYQDGYGRGLTISCVMPVRNKDGKFCGALAIDILMQDINESLINDGIKDPNKAVLIDKKGSIIASADVDPTSTDSLSIFDESQNSPLKNVSDQLLNEDNGLATSQTDDGELFISFSTIKSTQWVLCVLSPVEEIIAPAVKIRSSIDANTSKVTEVIVNGIRDVLAACLVLFAVLLLLITYFVGRAADKITTPLKTLTRDVSEISRGDLNYVTQVNTSDEIGTLANAFNSMTKSLRTYIDDLTDATAREERISSELSMATRIQADHLPSEYPAFPERDEFDLFFTSKPAKEVGGDFYDFFLIDDSHLGILIADVSGKGVPAALFMMISKVMIKNRAKLGGTPSEILSFANNQLCENNKVEMFVTVWLGILDLKTGILTASNAGHEFPAVKHADGKFELFLDRHGFVLAGMEGSRYRDYTIQMNPGDMLYVYTDGVAEATNSENELFGTERMLDALNNAPSEDCKDVIHSVLDGVEAFVAEAPQFDDITMLCLRLDKLMKDDSAQL